MALNELFDTFKDLRILIETHRDYLEGNEARTRQILIDPLLKELGWDVTDPGQVGLEMPVDKTFGGPKGYFKPDYVLRLDEDNVVAVVEAKKLGGDFDEAQEQTYQYADEIGVRWALATDGDRWEMYDRSVQGGRAAIISQPHAAFRIASDAPSTCALKALAIWNPNLCAKPGPIPAKQPVQMQVAGSNENEQTGGRAHGGTNGGSKDERDWLTLSRELPIDKQPMSVLIGGIEKKAKSWRAMYLAICEFLVSNNTLSSDLVPLHSESGKTLLVSDDEARWRYHKQIGNGMYVNVHGGGKGLLPRSVDLLESLQFAVSAVQVRFD